MRRLLAALAVAVGVLIPLAAPAAPASASPPHATVADGQLGIRLLDAPTNRRDDPRARIYVVDHLHQGQSITRHLEISNTTTGSLSVQLYAASATVDGGEFRFGEARAANDLTGWTTIAPTAVDVPAGGVKDATVVIAVPKDATDGERYAVLWAQTASTGTGSISSISRVGVRVYLSVGEGKEPRSSFTVDSLQAERGKDGTPVVVAQVHNTGERALDMRGSLRLTNGPGGLSAGPFDATLGTTLAPGETEPVRVLLSKAITGGPWTATLALSSGQTKGSVQGVVTFPAAGASAAPVPAHVVRQHKSFPIVATIAGVIIGLLLLGLLWFFFFWRRRDDEDREQGTDRPAVP